MRRRRTDLSTSRCMIVLPLSYFAYWLILVQSQGKREGCAKEEADSRRYVGLPPCFERVLTIALQNRRRAESGRLGLYQWMGLYHICIAVALLAFWERQGSTFVSNTFQPYGKKSHTNIRDLQTIRYACTLENQGLGLYLTWRTSKFN
jgi:hypothetical protein